MENIGDDYKILASLWSSGTGSYHSLFSSYLAANSVFVAATVFLTRDYFKGQDSWGLGLLAILASIGGFVVAIQMALALGRFSAINGFFEWKMRGIERKQDCLCIFSDLYKFCEKGETIKDEGNTPDTYTPNWAIKNHRAWWAGRSQLLPKMFGLVYVIFLFINGYLLVTN